MDAVDRDLKNGWNIKEDVRSQKSREEDDEEISKSITATPDDGTRQMTKYTYKRNSD